MFVGLARPLEFNASPPVLFPELELVRTVCILAGAHLSPSAHVCDACFLFLLVWRRAETWGRMPAVGVLVSLFISPCSVVHVLVCYGHGYDALNFVAWV